MSRKREDREKTNRTLVVAVPILAAAALALQLFVPPVIGLADNGDYQRVMGYAGFQHTTSNDAERYFAFLRTRYAVVHPGWFRPGYHSSETLLAFVARGAHRALGGGAVFDLRTLAAIHAALLLVALAGLVRACRGLAPPTQIAAAALLVLVFTDVGYVAPFQSFYSQTASLLFLLLTAAVVAEAIRRARLAGPWLAAYFAGAILFVGSKPQERLAAPLLALYGMRLAGTSWRAPWRSAAAWLAAALCAFAVWYGRHTPYTLRESTMFQVVFGEILGRSESPARDAAELGLDPDWLRYAGTNAYGPDSPLLRSEFRMAFLHRVGYRKVLRFYLHHPTRLAARLERASRDLWTLRPAFGNYERSAGRPPGARTNAFAVWSGLLEHLGKRPVLWASLLFGASLAAATAGYRRASPRERLFREAVILLVAMAGLAFFVCALADAPVDDSRALYSFHALVDLLLIADACWIVQKVESRRRDHVIVEAS
ncbi:MAG TPA: hypothetical protein VFA98_07925 [Thermoanaerobaculia bacterium]|nr:hypothetical protein [Thermoanaerobaculia bacterium]